MIRYKQLTGKSKSTIANYRLTFKKLIDYFESESPSYSITKGEAELSLERRHRQKLRGRVLAFELSEVSEVVEQQLTREL